METSRGKLDFNLVFEDLVALTARLYGWGVRSGVIAGILRKALKGRYVVDKSSYYLKGAAGTVSYAHFKIAIRPIRKQEILVEYDLETDRYVDSTLNNALVELFSSEDNFKL